MQFTRKIALDIVRGFVEYLLFFPIILLIGTFLLPKEAIMLWLPIVFGVFSFGIMVKNILPVNWSIYPLLAIIIGIIPSYMLAENLIFLFLLIILHSIVAYRGMLYASRNWDSLLPISYLWLMAFIIYFVCYFIFHFVDRLLIYENIVTTCGVVAVVITLFITNTETLKASSLSKEENPYVSSGVKRHNRLLFIITVIIAILLTTGTIIRDTIWNTIRIILKWLFGQSTSEGEVPPMESPPANPLLPGMQEPAKQSAIMKFLETVMLYFVYICLIVLVVFVLLLMIKRSRLWIKRMFFKFIAFLKQISNRAHFQKEDGYYTDEKESVFDWDEWKKAQQEKVANLVGKIFKRDRDWNSLNMQEKVRYIYRNYLSNQQGIAIQPASTPREILSELRSLLPDDKERIELLMDSYEKTRYGERDIDEKTMDEIYLLIMNGDKK